MSSSPPVLPLPRQPSPLHLSAMEEDRRPSIASAESSFLRPVSSTSSSVSLSANASVPAPNSHPSMAPRMVPLGSPISQDSYQAESTDSSTVPISPLPDSLVYRSTLSSLESSASTLKRLTKAVLAQAAVYNAMLEQMEKAEDEFLGSLGDLGRYLEGGFEVPGNVWTREDVRSMRREEWKDKRDQLEGVLTSAVRAVKSDIKRQGLAGSGAQDRYDRAAKQYYAQTSEYLSQGAGDAGSSRHGQGASSSSTANSDAAQAARSAQFDLARYSHHSALLYSVPPSSVSCLDLLVNMYTWTSGLIGDVPDLRASGPSEAKWGQTDGVVTHGRSQASMLPRSAALKSLLASNLAQLADMRVELLQGWSVRNAQTSRLEIVARANSHLPNSASSATVSLPPARSSGAISPGVTSPVEHKHHRSGKMHKIQLSVGGKLRELLSPGSGQGGHHHGRHHKRAPSPTHPRASTDDATRTEGAGIRRNVQSSPGPEALSTPWSPLPLVGTGMPPPPSTSGLMLSPTLSDDTFRRPSMTSRRSTPAASPRPDSIIDGYPAAALSPDLFPLGPADSPEIIQSGPVTRASEIGLIAPRRSVSAETRRAEDRIMGVGGVNGAADEDERREAVGRKREGVLWGAGVWEELGRVGGKLKWEKLWVVLDRSQIYEYRDTDSDRPETAHAVIDLKFASVREGRGTDRRFVFEIVTSNHGRRLYQATSDTEMKEWLYAIANAIESCINGTSTIRTFDRSKLRTPSGALDDHALPVRTTKLFPGLPARNGSAALPSIPGQAGNRRSLPAVARGSSYNLALPEDQKRNRRTSLKHVLRQGAGIAGERWNSVMNTGSGAAGHRASFDGLRPPFLAPTDRSDSRLSASTVDSSHMLSPGTATTSGVEVSPVSSRHQPEEAYVPGHGSTSLDGDIEKRVMEMAVLGLGISPSGENSAAGRRILSEAPQRAAAGLAPPEGMTRSHSADTRLLDPVDAPASQGQSGAEAAWDMAMLRRIVEQPGNSQCADCGKNMKSSRWASISLREVPMVIFLCIRCCGQHRSLGTHISKPRSVDLDTWTPQTIKLASEWGNQRANAIWERLKDPSLVPTDQDIGDFIRAKYVEGRWLVPEDRATFGLPPV